MINIKYAAGVWFLILLNHVLMIIGIYYASYHWFILTFIGMFIMGLGGDIGTHRYLAHRSFKTGPIRDFLLQFMGILTCVGSPMVWAMFHRQHHKNSDIVGDPHSPNLIPWLKVWACVWVPELPQPRECRDLYKNRLTFFIHKYYFYIIFLVFILLYLIDWRILIFLICIPSVIVFHLTNSGVNVICHKWGYRNFDTHDNSKNNIWVNYLTAGAGLHNNHHANPDRYSNKINSNERDFCGWIIKKFLKT
tara:strand:- start:5480 stop:6226 length:747 start_codon:yes stop_codon:yes gene_type:complete